MRNSVDFESVLSLIDQTINPMYLNPTQEIVLREVWKGKTYSEMACDYNYDPEYIKSVGCNLWQTLSRAFNKQINKSNFVPFMRQKTVQLLDSKNLIVENSLDQVAVKSQHGVVCHWTTAPSIHDFVGREEEVATLNSWSQESNCRCIVVSGMVGCGKTTLVTQFGQQAQDQFDRVIWFSILHTPSLKMLLHSYLQLMNQQNETDIAINKLELSFLLSQFIECLKKERILLIVDGLQSILQVNQTSISYKEEFEDYGQFLRSVITSNHQSLLVATSRIKPKMLEYYVTNQVKFLDLRGFDFHDNQEFFQLYNNSNPKAENSKISLLSDYCQGNPQLINIISKNLDNFSWTEDNAENVIQELCLFEEVAHLLRNELSYLSSLDQEILYWLAISCLPISQEELGQYTKQSKPKLKFSLNCLVKRSLIEQQGANYSLMPIMKAYLRRKLVKEAINS